MVPPFVSSARPISQILPADFHLFPSSSSTSSTAPSNALKPRPNGHYRPHSTLCTESPYIEVQERPPRLLKRSSSFGGLQSIQKMSLGLSLKPRKNVQSPSVNVSQFGTPSSPKVSLALSYKQKPPKTTTHVTKTATTTLAPTTTTTTTTTALSPTLRKKRSMISLFSNTSAASSPTEPSFPSPLGARPLIIPPSIPEHSPKKTTINPQRIAYSYDPNLPPLFPHRIWRNRHGLSVHPYPGDVPYMQSYNPIQLQSDRYSDLLLQRLSKGSPSFLNFNDNIPSTSLDLGCGEGHWIMHASSIWKETQFTGFDVVNITTPTFKSLENVHFVHGDFVKYKLPFPDNTFDHVRMANLLLCIPFFQTAKVLAEVRRVLKYNGRVEVIDDQLFFPYSRPPKFKKGRPSSFESNSSSQRSFDDSDLDGDTLHGYGSGEDSTFNSEGTCVSSYEEDEPSPLSSLPTSETVKPICRSRPSCSVETYEDGPFGEDDTVGRSDSCDWKRKAINSRNVEALFQAMLLEHNMIPHPSQTLAGILQYTFGTKSACKVKSFHIKLAEWNSPIGPNKKNIDHVDVFGELGDSLLDNNNSTNNNRNNVTGSKKKPWSSTKLDREMTKSRKKENDHVVLSSAAKVPSEFPVIDSTMPECNIKAAKKLGISVNPNSTPTTPSKPIPMPENRKERTLPSVPSSASFPSPDASSSPVRSNSTKTTKVSTARTDPSFGGEYNELLKPVDRTPVLNGLFKPRGLVQSPGLLIGDGEYLAIEPEELEMHACKYLHTLLGCKSALAKFVDQCRDVDGKPYVSEKEFDSLLWEYEMFRRARLGWPSGNDFCNLDGEDGSSSSEFPPSSASALLSTISLKDDHLHRDSSSSSLSFFSSNSSSSAASSFFSSPQRQQPHQSLLDRSQEDEPIPIRTIRVYEGMKTDEDECITFGVFVTDPSSARN